MLQPISKEEVKKMAEKYAVQMGLSKNDTALLVSFSLRVYMEGRLAGTEEVGKIFDRGFPFAKTT